MFCTIILWTSCSSVFNEFRLRRTRESVNIFLAFWIYVSKTRQWEILGIKLYCNTMQMYREFRRNWHKLKTGTINVFCVNGVPWNSCHYWKNIKYIKKLLGITCFSKLGKSMSLYSTVPKHIHLTRKCYFKVFHCD